MTRRRWIADEVSGDRAALTGAHADHLVRILRARIGQQFDVAAGGKVRRGTVAAIEPDRVELELGEEVPASAAVPITLILSIFKFDRMEWALEKCTELGVAKIIPAIAQRTEKHLADAAEKRMERWQRIVRQASEQSRRNSVPEISPPARLKDVIHMAATCRVVLAENEKDLTLREALASCVEGDTLLAIGPEGGWTEAEMKLFRGADWIAASLGQTVLRAETAAIAATAIAMAELS